MDYDRLNSPNTSAISLEVMGHRLHISQDPNSKHLGTTVWDASMVFVKFLEKNSRKGRFCPSKLKGKRVIELGAGCGLAGFGMTLLGCDVTTTDQVEVLPLLMRNVERNRSWISQSNSDTVAELDWGNKEHIKAVEPPFDYIIGTDVIYSEHLLQPLMETITALSGPKTKILLGYEIRSATVHEKMMEMWKSNFIVKTVSKSKMDVKYQHPNIHLYMMDLKAPLIPEVEATDDNGNDDEEVVSNLGEDEDNGLKSESCSGSSPEAKSGSLDDWEIRRCGAMAARLLKDVKL
uniref:Tumor-related protein n=1 Tax=Zea mays TaxID=4577 RepID=A0A804NWB8_MAIZE